MGSLVCVLLGSHGSTFPVREMEGPSRERLIQKEGRKEGSFVCYHRGREDLVRHV